MTTPIPQSCPCTPQRAYEGCCGRYHAGIAAPDAEALMRSRYSAYVLGLTDYLMATWHPDTRPAAQDLADSAGNGLKWLGLRVDSHHHDDAGHARVRFVATYKVGGGSAQKMRESSRFVRESGRWYYVDGDVG